MKSYMEKPTYISSTGVIMDQYVPVEGDGKASLISLTGTKQVKTCIFIRLSFFMFSLQLFNFTKNFCEILFQVTDKVKGKGKTMMSIRKIRKYEDEFDPK